MSFHTKRSPSQAKKFKGCPGVLALCSALPDIHQNQSGPAAQLGTAVHGLIERCLKEGSDPETYRGRFIELIGDEESVSILRVGAKVPARGRVFFEVDSGMIDGAELMTTYVRERCKELGVDSSAVQTESRTNPLPERDDTSGTADVTIDAWPTMLEVADYKNGWNVVEHNDNEQLLAYLLGKALEADMAHESYRVTVIQPNAPHVEGRIRYVEATKESLLQFQKDYRKTIARCEEAEEAFTAAVGGERITEVPAAWAKKYLKAGDHCLFCDAQPICPARLALAKSQAKIEFSDEARDLEFDPDPEMVADILKWAPAMDALVRAASGWAQRSMESGHKMPGLKLVRGKSNRRWADMAPADIVREILKGKFIADKSKLYTPPELISGPQAVKLVEKKKREKFEAKFLVKPEGKLTVAPVDDPREAVDCSAADDFADDVDAADAADELEFG